MDKDISDSLCSNCKFGISIKLTRREVFFQSSQSEEGEESLTQFAEGEPFSQNEQAKSLVAEDDMVGGVCYWPIHAFPQSNNVEPISVQVVKSCCRFQKRD